ncbi:MAG TPA: peptidylprolyl isomerase [Polyangium sp.]|nr:peptidylprolyl isomerase [Polyangium sp.]
MTNTGPSSTMLLAAGAGVGAMVAALGILQAKPANELPPQAIATVNGTYILRDDYNRAVSALEEALKKHEGPEENSANVKQRALDRLIDEELLVQRGIELGLPERDPQLRTQLSGRVLEMIAMAQSDDEPPVDEKTLRDFYEKEPGRFRLSGRFQVEVIFFAVTSGATADQDAQAKRRALDGQARLAKGERFNDVQASGDALLVTLPDIPLPLNKLQDYLGSTATRAVAELREGQVSDPIRGADGYRLLKLVERVEGETPTFEAVRQDVENAYRKQQEDVRLQRFLARRRKLSTIVIAPKP